MNEILQSADASSASTSSVLAANTDWWRGAVIYQIYPRSYQDTNNDGVGDLRGITQRLSYIASLGVDAIWISPFFESPMLDFGYDVSNYEAVDPVFGTLDDFDELVDLAHELGLKVMIDQVISHSSDQHLWFKESRMSRDNPRSDWYVWADAKPDGSPPNNWQSIFGGPAWEWSSTRRQYYLHNFLRSQPDLNFHNIEVQDALLNTVRFWLERGVDGFRLDTINFYVHDKALRDNPPLPDEERDPLIAPDTNPYNLQDHRHDKNRPENVEFLKKFRVLLDEYGAAAVGEVSDTQYALQLMSDYTSGGDKVQMCYSFDFLSPETMDVARVTKIVSAFENAAPTGWSCWAFSNHDVERHASRWASEPGDRDAYLKMMSVVLLTLRGSVCLYQGEELGLTESDVAFEDLQDPFGIQFWPEIKSRDGCRTPMVWTEGDSHGGFSTSTPWLPVPQEHLALAVDAQQGRQGTLLEHYRTLINFRKQHDALIKGSITFLDAPDNVLMFKRNHLDKTILVAINMADESVVVAMPENAALIDGGAFGGELNGSSLTLGAYGSILVELDLSAGLS